MQGHLYSRIQKGRVRADDGKSIRERLYGNDAFCRRGKDEVQAVKQIYLQEFNDKFENKVSDNEWDALYKICYAADSRVGGYPLFVQSAPAYYDDGEYDTVLLQLDCEDECGIMFGDAGNCYFLISKEDLKKRSFDNVEYGWQCC